MRGYDVLDTEYNPIYHCDERDMSVKDAETLLRKTIAAGANYKSPATNKTYNYGKAVKNSLSWEIKEKGPFEVLPGFFATDKNVLNCQRALCDKFSGFEPTSEHGYITGIGIGSNLDNIKQIPGVDCSPNPSSGYVENVKVDPILIRILGLTTKVLSRRLIKTNAYINRQSSTGFPTNDVNITIKKDAMMSFESHLDEYEMYIMDVVEGRCRYSDFDSYGIPNFTPLVKEGSRKQETDPPGKIRQLTDFFGNVVDIMRDTVVKGFSAMRHRIVKAYPSSVNIAAGLMGTSWQDAVVEDFPETYYTTRDALASSFEGFYPIGLDMKNFDNSFTPEVNETIIDNHQSFSDFGKNFLRFLLHMPLLLFNQYKGQRGIRILNSDWYNKDVSIGNPSGWGLVSIWAKTFGTAIGMSAIIKFLGYQHESDEFLTNFIVNILSGKNDKIKFKNCGDDMAIGFKDIEDLNSFDEFLSSKECDFSPVVIEKEHILKYLGNMLYKDGDVQAKPILNIHNMPLRLLCPEVPITHKTRVLYKLGLKDRKLESVYGNHPWFWKYFPMLETHFKHFFGYNPYGFEYLDLNKDEKLYYEKKLKGEYFTESDYLFMADPSVIHYKVKPSDVNQELLDFYYEPVNFSSYPRSIKLVKEDRLLSKAQFHEEVTCLH